MRKLHPMTDEERAFAETWHPLVFEFLDSRRLPELDFYDVVVFGFIAAVQYYVSNGPTAEVEFVAMARRSMLDAVLEDRKHNTRKKRSGVVISLDQELDGLDGPTLYGVIQDTGRDTARQTESKLLTEAALQVATDREAEILPLVAKGHTIAGAARDIGISPSTAYSRVRRFRQRARAAVAV